MGAGTSAQEADDPSDPGGRTTIGAAINRLSMAPGRLVSRGNSAPSSRTLTTNGTVIYSRMLNQVAPPIDAQKVDQSEFEIDKLDFNLFVESEKYDYKLLEPRVANLFAGRSRCPVWKQVLGLKIKGPNASDEVVEAAFKQLCTEKRLDEGHEWKGFVGETVFHILFLLNGDQSMSTALMRLATKIHGKNEWFLNAGYGPGVYEGETALHLGVANNNTEEVRWLLEESADLDHNAIGSFFPRFRWGESPVAWAACGHKTGVLEMLLKQKANIHQRDTKHNTILHNMALAIDICDKGDFKEVWDILKAHDATFVKQVHMFNGDDRTPLQVAAASEEGNFQALMNVLQNFQWKFGTTECTNIQLRGWDPAHSRQFQEGQKDVIERDLFVYEHYEHLEENIADRLEAQRENWMAEDTVRDASEWERRLRVIDRNGRVLRPPFDNVHEQRFPLKVKLDKAQEEVSAIEVAILHGNQEFFNFWSNQLLLKAKWTLFVKREFMYRSIFFTVFVLIATASACVHDGLKISIFLRLWSFFLACFLLMYYTFIFLRVRETMFFKMSQGFVLRVFLLDLHKSCACIGVLLSIGLQTYLDYQEVGSAHHMKINSWLYGCVLPLALLIAWISVMDTLWLNDYLSQVLLVIIDILLKEIPVWLLLQLSLLAAFSSAIYIATAKTYNENGINSVFGNYLETIVSLALVPLGGIASVEDLFDVEYGLLICGLYFAYSALSCVLFLNLTISLFTERTRDIWDHRDKYYFNYIAILCVAEEKRRRPEDLRKYWVGTKLGDGKHYLLVQKFVRPEREELE